MHHCEKNTNSALMQKRVKHDSKLSLIVSIELRSQETKENRKFLQTKKNLPLQPHHHAYVF